MAFEEEAAYALTAWARYDAAMTNELLRAVTSAFALVAVADGDLARTEIDRFILLLRERSAVLAPLDIDRVDYLFRDLYGALLSDPAGGHRRALASIAAVEGNAEHCELVRSAAEIAVAADHRELAAEQKVLTKICQAMSTEPR